MSLANILTDIWLNSRIVLIAGLNNTVKLSSIDWLQLAKPHKRLHIANWLLT
jgi:hypothetical protein